MYATVGKVCAAAGILVAVLGILFSTGSSGFFDSLIFWGIVGAVIAAVGLDWAERRGG